MIDLVENLAKILVDKKDEVSVNEVEGSNSNIIELRVNKEEVGKIIGKGGKIADAFRTIVHCAGKKIKKKYMLQIID